MAPVATRLEMLPLGLGTEPQGRARRVMKILREERWAKVQDPYENTAVDGSAERKVIGATGITCRDMLPVYLSKDPYQGVFEERLDMRQCHAYGKRRVVWSLTRQQNGSH